MSIETVDSIITSTASPSTSTTSLRLRDTVKQTIERYFAQLGSAKPANIYEMVISEVETPLLEAILKYTRGNQSRAAKILGISRGTLRKKLKIYGLDE
ncbi:MAG: DNA-binding transcriptional regulator Fis [Legionellales bacterium]|nr:DNA-binding transcriptional regulator Fis [Legionellales bacterium]